MNRRHATVIALFLALALVAGLFAALRTTRLGATSATPTVSAAQIAQRNRQLDAVEAKLRTQAKQKPPALPALPPPTRAASARSAPAAAAPPAASQPQRVIYVRPAPIVKVVPRHGESEHEDRYEHESEHDGGELDD